MKFYIIIMMSGFVLVSILFLESDWIGTDVKTIELSYDDEIGFAG